MGRPRVYKNNKLQWNNKGQLLLYENENLDKFEYKYDSNGIRYKKIINGKETNYITNGTQILQMKNDNGKFIFHYILNKLVGFEYTNTSGTKEYLYIRNIQGDITSIIDTKGNIICTYAYDGYGNHIVLDENGKEDTSLTSIGHLNPFRYRGYYFDEESGLYYLNSRYYDPETGRFISPDVLSILDETKGQINGLNLYMYCRDNPIMYIDDSGYLAWWQNALIALAGVVLIVGLAIATVATGGTAAGVAGAIFAGALKGALIGATIGTVAGGAIGYAVAGVNGIWTGMAIGFTGGAIIGAIIGGTVGGMNYSPIKAASNAANKAIPSKGFNINKHLSSAGGNYKNFNLDSPNDILKMVQKGLKGQNVSFLPNKVSKSWQVIVDMGVQIGTKGERAVKVIIGYGGKIWTMFPV